MSGENKGMRNVQKRGGEKSKFLLTHGEIDHLAAVTCANLGTSEHEVQVAKRKDCISNLSQRRIRKTVLQCDHVNNRKMRWGKMRKVHRIGAGESEGNITIGRRAVEHLQGKEEHSQHLCMENTDNGKMREVLAVVPMSMTATCQPE